MDATTLFLSVLFGSIGSGLFMFGWRQQRLVAVAAGVALVVVPYVLPGALALSVVGTLLSVVPFFVAL